MTREKRSRPSFAPPPSAVATAFAFQIGDRVESFADRLLLLRAERD